MSRRYTIAGAIWALILAQMTSGAFAQEHRRMIFTQALPAQGAGADGEAMFFNTAVAAGSSAQFLFTEMSFEGAVVKGAPYSAEAVTETTQTLGDGNRITRKTSASLYRDGEGRSRRDQALPAVGPWATSGTPLVNVFINDPVLGVSYILDSNAKTARKQVAGKIGKVGAPAAGITTYHKTETVHRSAPQSNEQALPSQLIEGVQAEGTRTTITIPAGEIGNDRPIEIVSERWYSPELKTVMMSKHSDPRMGETVYKLKGLLRGEPSRSLFDVPADYTLADESNPEVLRQHKVMVEKMIIEHKQ